MVCRRKRDQKSLDEMRKFRGRSRQGQRSLSLGIPLLEPLERLSGELGMGFYPIVLNESRENSRTRSLEKSEFRIGKSLQLLGWVGSGLPASDARPCTS